MIDEIKQLIKEYPKGYSAKLRSIKYKYLLNYINEKTPLLQDSFYNIPTKTYWILNNLTDFPICPTCGKKYGFKQLLRRNKGYYGFCSVKCSSLNFNTQQKNIKTNLTKYGVEWPSQSKIVRQKITNTYLDRYGVEHIS